MIWGWIAALDVGSLHLIERNMDKWQHLNILKNNLRQSAEKLYIGNTFHMYQVNDPKTTVVREWLL